MLIPFKIIWRYEENRFGIQEERLLRAHLKSSFISLGVHKYVRYHLHGSFTLYPKGKMIKFKIAYKTEIRLFAM
jgi:hypothetical protein